MNTDRRVALVTGASYGIGGATALALARDGYDVAVAATRVENLKETVGKAKDAGARALAIALDVRAPTSIENAVSQALAAFGRIDVLVNNAAITLKKNALDVTPEEWDDVNAVNIRGAFFMCQQMGRHLISGSRPGCIVNIASTHGMIGFPTRSVYGITKAAMIHMTKMLAIEWAPHGIRVNAIAPGRVESGSPLRTSRSDPKLLEALHNRVPLHRSATNEEVAEAVRYLASPLAGYITGHTLVLDGGLTAY